MKATAVAAMLAVLMSAVAEDSCPAGAIYGENFDKCYIMVKESATFEMAEEICAVFGGYLVSIHSAFENAFVVELADEHFFADDYWIGLTDPQSNGVWKWEDGSEASYTNWATGFPVKSNVQSLSCVVSLGGSGKWYNTLCDDMQPNLVCEVSACPGRSPTTGECDKELCPFGYDCTAGNKCCTAPLTNCTGKYKAGSCAEDICALGFSCDATDSMCCPSAATLGTCVDLPGVGASCPVGYVCYPLDVSGNPTEDSLCYQMCNGLGETAGPAIGGTCPQGSYDILGECCDAF